jgi:hypothetical protein
VVVSDARSRLRGLTEPVERGHARRMSQAKGIQTRSFGIAFIRTGTRRMRFRPKPFERVSAVAVLDAR